MTIPRIHAINGHPDGFLLTKLCINFEAKHDGSYAATVGVMLLREILQPQNLHKMPGTE